MDRIARRAQTARRLLRAHGPGGLVYLVAQRLQQRTKPHAHVEWFHVLETHPASGGDPISPEWITAGDPRAGELTALGLTDAEVAERLRRGPCAAHFGEGAAGGLYAYLWVHDHTAYDEEGVLFALRPHDVWMYDGVVRPDQRGRRLHPRLFLGVARDLQVRHGDGLRLVSTADAINTSSIRAYSNRGARRIGAYLLLRLGPLRVLREDVGGRARWRVSLRPIELPVPAGPPRPDAVPSEGAGSHRSPAG